MIRTKKAMAGRARDAATGEHAMICHVCKEWCCTTVAQLNVRRSNVRLADGSPISPHPCPHCGGTDWMLTEACLAPHVPGNDSGTGVGRMLLITAAAIACLILVAYAVNAAPVRTECVREVNAKRGWVWSRVDGRRCWYPRGTDATGLFWKVPPPSIREISVEIPQAARDNERRINEEADEAAADFRARWEGKSR